MALGQIYFWTATINQWQYLLKDDAYKNVIIDSLSYLSDKGKIDVFAFVIMPNHIHMIWRIKEKNGKEMPQASLLKYTAHEFRKMLIEENKNKLSRYAVNAANKAHEFWRRDSLAVHLYTSPVAYQKLNYIHLNPVSKHWRLAYDPCDYPYSKAVFYEKGVKRYSFVKDLREEFGW
ncbi:MAG: transposase [Cytophagaceae bacterium]|nr:transposase [Cytophagaceae bacterium]